MKRTETDGLGLRLWTEAGKHLDLSESLPVFVDAISRLMPVESVDIHELGADRGDLLWRAHWSAGSGLHLRHHAHGCTPAALRALEAWAARRQVLEHDAGRLWPAPFAALDGFVLDDAALAGPLFADGRAIGVLVVSVTPDSPRADASAFERVLEPMAAALANDQRLHEIERLRASAEADRQSLLSRLGRQTVAEAIVGADRGLRRVMERVSQVAASDATVLILGETGSGKEVVARAIHERSPRHAGPFVRVNCGAVPPDLIDSELFGHEKGSFTGAVGARRGWFERADGGTLFLDEIGELTPAVQIRLLRVLQDGIVQRVGSERETAVNVRVVAATHRDLPTMVQEGRFREDLWYRLAVFPVILPPLRERPEDIPALTEHFVQRAANRLGVPVPPVRERDLEQLLAYRWPGNVRELGAVLERAVILGQGASLDLQTALGAGLPRPTLSRAATPAVAPERAGDESRDIVPLDLAIAAHLQRALRATRGRVDGPHGAAQLLHINTSTLRAKLRKLGIDPRGFRR
ncbi:MAG: sigma-54-dependent Fis family transcriptional regulator [Sinimarinibacterium sp.]|jgi:transcriptional regulator with GAF, ATPase, and Fis domain